MIIGNCIEWTATGYQTIETISPMDDDWAPILRNDCLFSVAATIECEEQGEHREEEEEVKCEPLESLEDTSDYHGSTSVSPSSSLSSPADIKHDFGVDFSSPLCVNPFNGPASFLHSPASSSGSPFGLSFPSCASQNSHNGQTSTSCSFSSSMCGSPLPPVSHFSQMTATQMSPQAVPNPMQRVQQQQQQQQQPQWNGGMVQQGAPFFIHSQGPPMMEVMRSPSPPLSEGDSCIDVQDSAGLAALQAQQRTRSKMHEMAVRQKLITDQDGRGNGCVQLSSEEKRTLLQEGYTIPTRLPLSKAEEEALKIVRRKIKNKLSAQESRRKRKEYMDTLEQRVQVYFAENQQLKHKVKQMEMNNRNMMARLKQLEQMVDHSAVMNTNDGEFMVGDM